MAVRVVGAGLGRTGTYSLKAALERLLGGTCHHMLEVIEHPAEVPVWHAAAEGVMPDWHDFLAGYTATVDWPSAAFWSEISSAFPDAIVLLSVRDPDSWYTSIKNTLLKAHTRASSKAPGEDPWADMVMSMMRNRFVSDLEDEVAAKAAFVAHNEQVRAEIEPDRLVVWEPAEGWLPICGALDLPVPNDPFPLTNTAAEFIARSEARPD